MRKVRIDLAFMRIPKNLIFPHGNHTTLPGEFRLPPAPAFVFSALPHHDGETAIVVLASPQEALVAAQDRSLNLGSSLGSQRFAGY
jgi:hypothetical protein